MNSTHLCWGGQLKFRPRLGRLRTKETIQWLYVILGFFTYVKFIFRLLETGIAEYCIKNDCSWGRKKLKYIKNKV